MTLDEAVTRFQSELPGWWWKIISCSISVEADCAPEVGAGLDIDAARKVDERFNSGFTVELRHTAECTYTPAEALLALLAEAKDARAAYLRGEKPRPGRSVAAVHEELVKQIVDLVASGQLG